MDKWPLHPFLFALFSILSFYSVSTVFAIPSVLVFPVLITLATVLVLVVSIWRLSGNIVVATFVTTFIVFTFIAFRFAYESVCNLQMLILNTIGLPIVPVTMQCFLVVWLLLALVLIGLCWRHKAYLERKTKLVNTVSLCCLLVVSADVLVKEVSRRLAAPSVVHAIQDAVSIPSLRAKEKPDIYYIILDGCPRSDVLKELYHYDNKQFRDYLKLKGFYLAEDSHSNYQMTPLSLSSTLNMNYVNVAEKFCPKSNDWFPMIELIENNLVVKSLKSIGYKYVLSKTDWAVTKESPLADELISVSWNDVFLNRFLSTTICVFFEEWLGPLRLEAGNHWLRMFERVEKLDDIQSPKFVFFHCVLPHPPYLFNADGSRVSKGPMVMHLEEYADRHSFVEQVKFTEKLVERLIDRLLANSRSKPVIILQSDHGPASLDFNEDTEKPTTAFLKERMSIINAMYFPDGNYSKLYSSVTPVNTFRLLFNQYFGTVFEPLPDKSYFSNYLLPYKFIDVTERLKE
jgi:hypothetical protein